MPSTTSLKLSQRLAKLGVDAPSEHYYGRQQSWPTTPEMSVEEMANAPCVYGELELCEDESEFCSHTREVHAYTTDELLELLKHITIEKHLTFYRVTENQETGKIIQNESLVEALGLMLAYLKENKII